MIKHRISIRDVYRAAKTALYNRRYIYNNYYHYGLFSILRVNISRRYSKMETI
jgi:hypothetical protein